MKKSILSLSVLLSSVVIADLSFAQTTQTFNYTGAMQTFVVPAGVTSIDVDIAGASGGDVGNLSQPPMGALGGLGGRIQGTIGVIPGATLYVYVGSRGRGDSLTLSCFTATGGFNGGGNGYGGYLNTYNYNAGGGGGASDIRIGGIALANRKFVAGGGGGACASPCDGGGAIGGNGGGLKADSGQSYFCFPNCNFGYGGTQSAGGAAGSWSCSVSPGTAGVLGTGGLGSATGPVTCGCGGGGGGGYYGGGGGSGGPGGGGSNYADPTATAVIHTKGFQSGNGYVKITYVLPTGINSLASLYFPINIFPNPVRETAIIELGSDSPGDIMVLNAVGEIVLQEKINAPHIEISMKEYPAGIYFIKILTASGIAVRKIIKE